LEFASRLGGEPGDEIYDYALSMTDGEARK
jgi:hypothetical protein